VIVLHELAGEPVGPEAVHIEPLDEETALVAMQVELDEDDAVEW
jgi:hypothetical protein